MRLVLNTESGPDDTPPEETQTPPTLWTESEPWPGPPDLEEFSEIEIRHTNTMTIHITKSSGNYYHTEDSPSCTCGKIMYADDPHFEGSVTVYTIWVDYDKKCSRHSTSGLNFVDATGVVGYDAATGIMYARNSSGNMVPIEPAGVVK